MVENHYGDIIGCSYSNEQTQDMITVSLHNEEIEPGFPVVLISTKDDVVRVSLQDAFEMIKMLNSIFIKMYPFVDRGCFERNRFILKQRGYEKWVCLFDRYHRTVS